MDIQTLLTNDVFPEESRTELKLRCTAAATELALLEAEIALAELDLDLESGSVESPTYNFFIARKRRRDLLALIAACNVATAPQKHLPAELLSYIFQLSFAGYPTDLPPTGRNISPLALCHTCSRWRRVALNTPELWTDVVFRYARGLNPYKTLDLIEEWYARSGPLTALSLGINPWMHHTYTSDHDEVIQAILHRLVVPYAHRFRHLKLQLPGADLQSMIIMPNLSFPILESLQLLRDPWMKEGQHVWTRLDYKETNGSFWQNAPLLTDLEVHNFQGCRFIDTKFFPWTRLTRFFSDNTPISVSQSLAILRRCGNMVEFALSLDVISQRSEKAPVLSPQIELPYLRWFDVTFATESSSLIQPFLEPLFIPGVKELNIRSIEKMDNWDSSPLMSFLRRSCFNIEILHIWNFHLPGEVVAELVHTLPESLGVLLVGVDHLLPKATLAEIAGGRLLPNLRSLMCRVNDLETAIQLIENRLAGCESGGTFARPSFFMLDYISRKSITHDQAIRVDRLRENGVEVEITRT